MTDEKKQKTFLYDSHVELGARMAPFGGFEMPIQYAGILDEHNATRSGATVFDTCHMGEFRVRGNSALADLERLITCNIGSIENGRCRYGILCNEQGGALDDLLVYRQGVEEFMLVVNAGTQQRDFQWLADQLSADTVLENISSRTGKIDLQGPDAPEIAQDLLADPIDDMVYYSFRKADFEGAPVLVSRTGYTGEVGFEFYAAPGTTVKLWQACLAHGANPAGLGARDTLRLEMGMPLYGHELSEDRNVAQLGFDRAIAGDKDFIGSDRVTAPDATPVVLCGIEFPGRRAAREGDSVMDAGGGDVFGEVTSGSFAPSLGYAVALAYVDKSFATPGAAVRVRHGRKEIDGKITELPFYKDGTARKKLSRFFK